MQYADDPRSLYRADAVGNRGVALPDASSPRRRAQRLAGLARLALSSQARDRRRRERLAARLGQAVRGPGVPEAVHECEARILLIAAVLRSPLPLPVDGVAAVQALLRGRQGPLSVDGDAAGLQDGLREIEQALGMRGSQRRAARAIAAGEVAVLRSNGDA
jgi:hypothetical protein